MEEWLMKNEKYFNMKAIEDEVGAPIEPRKLKHLLEEILAEFPGDQEINQEENKPE